jgi:hypothetical protein
VSKVRSLVRYCPMCGDLIPTCKFTRHTERCSIDGVWETTEEYLSENGPTANDKLNELGYTVSGAQDVEVFNPHGLRGAGIVSRVAYLPIHKPGLVIRTWVLRNQDDIRSVSRSSITRRLSSSYDDEWVTAWKRIADEFEFTSHQRPPSNPTHNPDRTCPKCEQSVPSREFVRHLQNCS